MRSALRANGGNKLKAAGELGISRCYLHRLLHQFGMVEKDADQEQENEGLSGYETTGRIEPDSAHSGGPEMLKAS